MYVAPPAAFEAGGGGAFFGGGELTFAALIVRCLKSLEGRIEKMFVRLDTDAFFEVPLVSRKTYDICRVEMF